jgi:hypothetical protein
MECLKTDSGKSGSVGNKDKVHPMKWAGVQKLDRWLDVRRDRHSRELRIFDSLIRRRSHNK